jgi:hypothetical protein
MLKGNSDIPQSHLPLDEASDPSRSLELVAKRRFDKSGYSALRRLSCHCDGQRLIIRGQVGSYFEKQMAQASLRDLSDDLEIINETEVAWCPHCPDGSG